METISAGHLARLPDGQRIIIDNVHCDRYVTARRIEGEWEGMLVVCAITKLEPDSENPVSENPVSENPVSENPCVE